MLHAAIVLFIIAIIASIFGAGDVQHYAVMLAVVAALVALVAYLLGWGNRNPPAV